MFSSSNHTPFEYPEGKITPYNQPAATVENAVKYADYALGQFVERAKQSDYWESTIFIAVADHDSRASGSLSVPVGHFKIPAIIFGGGIEARQDSRLASQIDLPPTLLSLAGISSQNPMIGNDLTKDVPVDKQRALMQRGKNFGWMKADNGVVVIQPGQGISTYAYDPQADSLTPTPLSEADIKRAHANAMWGSLAFKKDITRRCRIISLRGLSRSKLSLCGIFGYKNPSVLCEKKYWDSLRMCWCLQARLSGKPNCRHSTF